MSKPNDIIRIDIAGQRYEFPAADLVHTDVVAAEDDTFHLLHAGKGYTITVLKYDAANRTALFRINGENREARFVTSLDILIEKMGLNRGSTKKLSSLIAPMPGLVKAISVQAGETAEEGSPLLILEAMKMENVMTAPHTARIRDIRVTVGQAVDKGATLIEFDPD